MAEEATKGFLGCLIGMMTYILNCFNELVVVLVLLILFDYIAGIAVAFREQKFDAKIGIWGAVKKLFYGMLILMAFLIDYSINYFGIQTHTGFSTHGGVGIASICYLIGTEGLSILKSFIILGIPVPPALKKAFGLLQEQEDENQEE